MADFTDTVRPTDRSLLDRCTRGESDALETLIRRHIDFVYATAVRRCADRTIAEDVTQDVFVTFAAKAKRLPANVVLIGWLHQTTLYAAANALKRAVRRRHHEARAAMEKTETLPAGDVGDREEAISRLDLAIGRLRSPSREAILLRFFQRLSLRDVGVTLGISEEAAKKRVMRAVDELRCALRSSASEGESATVALLGIAAAMPGASDALANSVLHAASTPVAGGVGAFSLKGTFVTTKAKFVAVVTVLLVLGGGVVIATRTTNSGVTDRASTKMPESSTTMQKLIGNVGKNVTAELVAFTRHVRKIPVTDEWWTPAGTPFGPRPYDQTLDSTDSLEGWALRSGSESVVEFAFKLHLQTPDNGPATMRWHWGGDLQSFMSGGPSTPGPQPSAKVPLENGYAWRFVIAGADPHAKQPPTSIRLDFATGPWKTIATATVAADGTVTTDGSSPAIFERVKPFDAWPAPTFTATLPATEVPDLRLIAIDRDGKAWTLHQSSMTSALGDSKTMYITSRADKVIDVVALRLERRPYSAMIVFGNLALTEGRQTLPSVGSVQQDDESGNVP